MFNVGGGEILVILLLALLVLGPDKLPEYARKAGRYMNEFRRMTSGFQEEFRQAMDLSDSASPPGGADDALDRATDGPRLLPQDPAARVPPPAVTRPSATTAPADGGDTAPSDPSPAEPAATEPATTEDVAGPSVVVPPAPVEPPTPPAAPPMPAYGAAFAADVTPAPGSGPELVVPSRPDDADEGDTGSSSAA